MMSTSLKGRLPNGELGDLLPNSPGRLAYDRLLLVRHSANPAKPARAVTAKICSQGAGSESVVASAAALTTNSGLCDADGLGRFEDALADEELAGSFGAFDAAADAVSFARSFVSAPLPLSGVAGKEGARVTAGPLARESEPAAGVRFSARSNGVFFGFGFGFGFGGSLTLGGFVPTGSAHPEAG